MEAILYSLRAAHLPALKPVLVLSCSRPPRRLANKCAHASLLAAALRRPEPPHGSHAHFTHSRLASAFLRFALLTFLDLGKALAGGSLDWNRALEEAGAAVAHAVLYLAGEAPCEDAFMIDRRAVLFTSVMEEQHKAWGKDVHLTVELHNPFSIWYLQESVPYANPVKAELPAAGGGGSGEAADGAAAPPPAFEAAGSGEPSEGGGVRRESSLWQRLTARFPPFRVASCFVCCHASALVCWPPAPTDCSRADAVLFVSLSPLPSTTEGRPD